MLKPSREMIQALRKMYPEGTRVRLIQMEDPQAPPEGTLGTVYWVDDMGSIGIRWDNGSRLSAIYGEDVVAKI